MLISEHSIDTINKQSGAMGRNIRIGAAKYHLEKKRQWLNYKDWKYSQ